MKSPITLVVLVILLISGVVIGFKLVTKSAPAISVDDGTSDSPTCKPAEFPAGQLLKSKQITIDVYNKTASAGLADQTMDALRNKGFAEGTVANAESWMKAGNVTVVTDEPDSALTRLLRKQFKGEVDVMEPKGEPSANPGIVLGGGFVGIDKEAAIEIELRVPTKLCVPIEVTPSA